MSTIRRMGKDFAGDGKITRDEAQKIVDKAKANGVVSKTEKADVRKLLNEHKDAFEPAAAALLRTLIDGAQPPQPPPPVNPPSGAAVSLGDAGANRPVFVSPTGSLVTVQGAAEPQSNIELGNALYRAAVVIDNAKTNPYAAVPADLRSKMVDKLAAALDQTAGLTEPQKNQLRATVSTSLLALAEASADPALQKKAFDAYVGLVKAEKFAPLRESMIFRLHWSDITLHGEARQVTDALMREVAPLYPPYEKWFANGNKTVNMEFTVGQMEFWKGFTNKLKQDGFTPVGTESQYGDTTYEKKVNKPGVGETVFRITVREGGINMLSPAGKPGVHLIGYDGHSNWGANISKSVKNAPQDPKGGDGQLFFYNMCVGKSGLDKVREKFPNMQVVTTYASSSFYHDANGQMSTGEGIQALLRMVDCIADRAPWTKLHKEMNAAANINRMRTWDNYVTPVSTLVREKVLDRDHDGQADYLDKVYSFNAFRAAEDTAHEFLPVKQERTADELDGTKVLMAGNMINTISEFSSVLDTFNLDSKVVPAGWMDTADEKQLVKFEKTTGAEGKTEYRMWFNSRYAHASEDVLRAMAIYEFNRYLSSSGQLNLDPLDVKVNGLILACHSLDIDEGYRDRELWPTFLKKFNLPKVDWDTIYDIKEAEHHHYSGSIAMIEQVKAALPADQIAALKQPGAGEPN